LSCGAWDTHVVLGSGHSVVPDALIAATLARWTRPEPQQVIGPMPLARTSPGGRACAESLGIKRFRTIHRRLISDSIPLLCGSRAHTDGFDVLSPPIDPIRPSRLIRAVTQHARCATATRGDCSGEALNFAKMRTAGSHLCPSPNRRHKEPPW